ncbi:phage tail tape measure protein [Aeromicrobium sp. 9AM]|uniref:phage tail tape measure protein n=1 Tax=Aeromicrobium sp. 9AM TaxID=2653126 RepID=UPI0012EF9EF2|nr:phage tail tape measure protein [Aeromicrobium sp. 9AM]VXB81774.1 conserved membrane hypothetical protein [Aeromicrobium sp. 9AM]
MSGDTLDLGTLVGYMRMDGSGWDRGIASGVRGIEGFKAKALLATAAIGGAAIGVGVALYKVGGIFDDVSDTIRSETGATGAELDGLVDSAKHVGTEVPASFEAIAPVIASLHQRLGLTGPLLERLTEQFVEYGRISGESLDPATVTAAFNAFNVKGKDASKTLDELFRVSQATGVPLSALISSVQRGAPMLTQFGFGVSESANLLGNLDKAGINGDKTVQALGRAMVEFAKKGKEPRKALDDTIGGIEDFIAKGKDADAVQLAAKIFGTRGAAQFVAAVKSGKLSVDALTSSTFKHGDTILKAGQDTADFAEQWQLFKNRALVQIEPIATRVFNKLGDGMAWINSTGAPALATLGDNFEDVGQAVRAVTGFLSSNQTTIAIVAGVITALLLPAIIAWGVQSLIAAKRNVAAWLTSKVEAASSAALQVMSLTLITAQWIRSAAIATASAVRQAAAWLISKAGVAGTIALYGVAFLMIAAGWVASAAAAMAGAVAMAAAWFIALGPIGWAIAAVALIVAVVIKYWDQISAFTKAAWDKVSGAVMGAVNWVIDFVRSHWPLILAIITGPIGLAVLFIVRNMDKIKGAMSAAWNAVKSGARAAWSGVTGIIRNGAESVVNAVRSIPGRLLSLVGKFASAGRSIINAFVGGLKNAGGAIGGIAGSVWGAVKKLLNGAISKINSALEFKISIPHAPDVHINPPNIPMLAKGGYADKATLAVFGEAGPEVALPLGSSKSKQAMAEAFGTGPGNSDELSARLDELLEETRAQNDYLAAVAERPIQLNVDRRQAGTIVQVGNAAEKRL